MAGNLRPLAALTADRPHPRPLTWPADRVPEIHGASEAPVQPDDQVFTEFGLPRGPVLFHLQQTAQGSVLIPVGEISGDSLRPTASEDALKLTDKDFTAVVGFRHFAMPLALNDAMWRKYKIGELIDVKDAKSGAPATRNIFRDNVPMRPGLTYEQAMTQRGLVVVACNMALTVLSGMAAPKAGVTADKAKAEWSANLLPGVYLAPSGVYAVNRSQEAGCTYCYAR